MYKTLNILKLRNCQNRQKLNLPPFDGFDSSLPVALRKSHHRHRRLKMTSYIDIVMHDIRKNRAIYKASEKSELSLTQKIDAWWKSETEENKFSSYSMSFFIFSFNVAPSKIGPALSELGWSKRRSWLKNKPFCRIWVPPIQNNESRGEL